MVIWYHDVHHDMHTSLCTTQIMMPYFNHHKFTMYTNVRRSLDSNTESWLDDIMSATCALKPHDEKTIINFMVAFSLILPLC